VAFNCAPVHTHVHTHVSVYFQVVQRSVRLRATRLPLELRQVQVCVPKYSPLVQRTKSRLPLHTSRHLHHDHHFQIGRDSVFISLIPAVSMFHIVTTSTTFCSRVPCPCPAHLCLRNRPATNRHITSSLWALCSETPRGLRREPLRPTKMEKIGERLRD
jgi:hypothetical protein